MSLLLIDAAAIERLTDMPAVIEAVEGAFIAYGNGQARMPPKIYLEVPGGDFRAMPAYLPGAAGVKWVNVHPDNPAHGLPTVMALIIYNDPATGRPLALIDGTIITRLRTGAAAAVATRRLARPGARRLAIIGCGGQADAHLQALCCVMKPELILLADARRENAEALARRWAQYPCRVAEIEQACAEADVISTLTPARRPYVRREWIRPGAHINAMGADAPGKQELEIDLLLAARVFVDDWAQASHSGEINVAVASGRLTEVAGALPDVICGRAPGRVSEQDITIFDSTGLAIQDLAVAHLVYAHARERGEGIEVEFRLG